MGCNADKRRRRRLKNCKQEIKRLIRNKQLILCGDWNINFMQVCVRLHDVQKLLSLHNMVNTVRPPTRDTKGTVTLIDVIITNKDSIGELATMMDLGNSDRKSQILQLNVKTIVRNVRKLNQDNILEKA